MACFVRVCLIKLVVEPSLVESVTEHKSHFASLDDTLVKLVHMKLLLLEDIFIEE